jgi:hypothetical protein
MHDGEMDDGEIEIESVEPIELSEVTPELARESRFSGVADLLKVARHGKGDNIYLIRFHYLHTVFEPPPPRAGPAKQAPEKEINDEMPVRPARKSNGPPPPRWHRPSTGEAEAGNRAGRVAGRRRARRYIRREIASFRR